MRRDARAGPNTPTGLTTASSGAETPADKFELIAAGHAAIISAGPRTGSRRRWPFPAEKGPAASAGGPRVPMLA